MPDTFNAQDKQQVQEAVGAFAWRDQSRWEDLRSTFAADGVISVSWYSGHIDGFISASQAMASKGRAATKHLIGTPRVSTHASRALAETDVVIMIRAQAGPIDVDITSHARFFDRLIVEGGQWKILSRKAIYEKDRIDPVRPSLLFWLAGFFISYKGFPPALRHLAMGLQRAGYPLVNDVIAAGSDSEAKLKGDALAWLSEGHHTPLRLP